MDPNRYLEEQKRKANEKLKQSSTEKPEKIEPPSPVMRKPVTSASRPVMVERAAEPEPKPVKPHTSRPAPKGRLCVSGKRFFGQILIDHWVIRINGEQKKLPFGKNKLSVELPAGIYLVTAYTPYLGMHCMRVTADIEIRPGAVTYISYQTVFDIFKNGVIRRDHTKVPQ